MRWFYFNEWMDGLCHVGKSVRNRKPFDENVSGYLTLPITVLHKSSNPFMLETIYGRSFIQYNE